MARLVGPLAFTGKLDGISAQKRKGSKGIIIKPRYGPSSHDIDTKPAYANTKRENKEFGGRSTTAKWIKQGYFPLHSISDPDNLGNLNAILKYIQEMDTESAYGKRNVYLTRGGMLLEGFQLNKEHPFESVLRSPVECSIIRSELKAMITLPVLLPGVNFHTPATLPFYRIVATLSVIPDMYFHECKYRPKTDYQAICPGIVKTEWMATQSEAEMMDLELTMSQLPPDDQFILVLTLGIEMGQAKSKLLIKAVKYAGCGKIFKVG
jgi:hypothetical protein